MSELVPCPSCERHIQSGETACPFCQATFSPARRCAAGCSGATAARLAKAALVAAGAAVLGAACQSQSVTPPYGVPPHRDGAAQSRPDAGEPTDASPDAKDAGK